MYKTRMPLQTPQKLHCIEKSTFFKQCKPYTQTVSGPKHPHIQPQATSSTTTESTLQHPLPKSQTTTLSTNFQTTAPDTTRPANIHDPNNPTGGEQLSISKFHVANIKSETKVMTPNFFIFSKSLLINHRSVTAPRGTSFCMYFISSSKS